MKLVFIILFIYLICQAALFTLYYFFIFENEELKARILASILVPFPIAAIIPFMYYIFAVKACSPEEEKNWLLINSWN